MKVLLALSLLLFLNSVFSQGNEVNCNLLEKCPEGYTPQYSGRTWLKAACICKKKPQIVSLCSSGLSTCRPTPDQACIGLESYCTPEQIIDFCNKGTYSFPLLCDRANQNLKKGKYANTQRTCEFYRDKCNRMPGDHCITATDSCDPDTIIQLCKNKRIPLDFICEAAEKQKEEDRAEQTKYSCEHAQKLCRANIYSNVCPTIANLCDAETAAKWCYKDDTNQIEKISDADCSRVVKKSQDLMFGRSKPECFKQVPLCEGGNAEACTLVATYCVKDVVSALCHAKKIKSKRICQYIGLQETASSSYPGCTFFVDKCKNSQPEYCPLASHYCDNETVDNLCYYEWITDKSICERAKGGNSGSIDIPLPIVGTIKLPGLGFGF